MEEIREVLKIIIDLLQIVTLAFTARILYRKGKKKKSKNKSKK